ncbi:unnamed protein product [Gordionus sp. m RMFG-2023]
MVEKAINCPTDPHICHGEELIERLCFWLSLDMDLAINGMRPLPRQNLKNTKIPIDKVPWMRITHPSRIHDSFVDSFGKPQGIIQYISGSKSKLCYAYIRETVKCLDHHFCVQESCKSHLSKHVIQINVLPFRLSISKLEM